MGFFSLNVYELHFVSFTENLNVEAPSSPYAPGVDAEDVDDIEGVAWVEEHCGQGGKKGVKALDSEENQFWFHSFWIKWLILLQNAEGFCNFSG